MESGNTWGSDDTFASNTTYYMRMIRDGDDFTCIRYSDTWGGTVAETLEKTVLQVIESGITTKDVGGNMSTREFTTEITNRLVSSN